MPRKANAKMYRMEGFVIIGTTARKIETDTVKNGIMIGTLNGRGTFGAVFLRIITQDMAAPYVIHMRKEASSTNTVTSPAKTNRIEIKPCK